MAERGPRHSRIETAKRIDIEHASLIQDAIKASTPPLLGERRSSWWKLLGERRRLWTTNPDSVKSKHVLQIGGKEIRLGYKPPWINNRAFFGPNPGEAITGDRYGLLIKSVHAEKPRRFGGVRLNIEHAYRDAGDFLTELDDKTREATAAILYSLAEDQGKLPPAIISRAEDLHAATVTKDTAGPGREYIFVPDEISQKIIRVDQAFGDESNEAKIAEARDLLANEEVQGFLRDVSSQAVAIEITERDGNRVVKIGEREVTISRQTVKEQREEEDIPEVDGFKKLIDTSIERWKERFPEFGQWYEERLAALPEMQTSPAPLTDGKNWRRDLTPTTEVDNVKGAHFTIAGENINVGGAGWTQPLIKQATGEVNLPIGNETEAMESSGFVGKLVTPDGRVLLTLGQEPGAHTPKKALLRPALQTSATKFQAILDGNIDADKNFANVLELIGGGQSLQQLLDSGTIEVYPLAPADANRIDATNIGFTIRVDDPQVEEALTADGKNRWCTQEEVEGLKRSGIANSYVFSS